MCKNEMIDSLGNVVTMDRKENHEHISCCFNREVGRTLDEATSTFHGHPDWCSSNHSTSLDPPLMHTICLTLRFTQPVNNDRWLWLMNGFPEYFPISTQLSLIAVVKDYANIACVNLGMPRELDAKVIHTNCVQLIFHQILTAMN